MYLLIHLQNLKDGTMPVEQFAHNDLKAAKAQAFQMCAYDTSSDIVLSYHVVIFDNMMREIKRYEDVLEENAYVETEPEKTQNQTETEETEKTE